MGTSLGVKLLTESALSASRKETLNVEIIFHNGAVGTWINARPILLRIVNEIQMRVQFIWPLSARRGAPKCERQIVQDMPPTLKNIRTRANYTGSQILSYSLHILAIGALLKEEQKENTRKMKSYHY